MAEEKITELIADILPAAVDVVAIVVDTGGTPITRKITHDDLLFGANGTPSTQAHSDSAAIGTALDAARSDHKHAMPAAVGGGPPQATQAAIEAETNEDTYIPPDLGIHNPGTIKARCHWNASFILDSNSFNIASVGNDSTGIGTITIATDMSSAAYQIALTPIDPVVVSAVNNLAVGSFKVNSNRTIDQGLINRGGHCMVGGDR